MTTLNVALYGASGKMGKRIQLEIEKQQNGPSISGLIDAETTKTERIDILQKSDVVIDFSAAVATEAFFQLIDEEKIKNKKILVCTTGHSGDQLSFIQRVTKENNLSTLLAPNTSVGILILYKTAMNIASATLGFGFDIEITESHHRNKIDHPSGTAKFLASGIENVTGYQTQDGHPSGQKRNEKIIGMHAIRGGGVFGEHHIDFLSEDEQITLTHRAFSRTLFAKGSLILARILSSKTPGFYNYKDLSLSDLEIE